MFLIIVIVAAVIVLLALVVGLSVGLKPGRQLADLRTSIPPVTKITG